MWQLSRIWKDLDSQLTQSLTRNERIQVQTAGRWHVCVFDQLTSSFTSYAIDKEPINWRINLKTTTSHNYSCRLDTILKAFKRWSSLDNWSVEWLHVDNDNLVVVLTQSFSHLKKLTLSDTVYKPPVLRKFCLRLELNLFPQKMSLSETWHTQTIVQTNSASVVEPAKKDAKPFQIVL